MVNAPPASGVYGLKSHRVWVYAGEGENIRAQMLTLLTSNNACLSVFLDLTFSYELLPPLRRSWRQESSSGNFARSAIRQGDRARPETSAGIARHYRYTEL
jgi:hypothetical protein